MNTLITISGGTCSGKDTLLKELVHAGYSRIISTTTRQRRSNETHGNDYYFISDEESKRLEENGEFAEQMTYGGFRYGITKQEFNIKLLEADVPAVMICEPTGLHEYVKYARAENVNLFSVFVDTPLEVRQDRLVSRTLDDIIASTKYDDKHKILSSFKNRIQATVVEESWRSAHDWDVTIDGTQPVTLLSTVVRFAVNSTCFM